MTQHGIMAGWLVEHYQMYLRAELGKLGNTADAAAFLGAGPCSVALVQPPTTVTRLARAFGSQPLVDDFVFQLSTADLVALTVCCGRWRGNNIAADLSLGQDVEVVEVPVAQILLRTAEPRLGSLFDGHGDRLSAIAADPALLTEPEYRNHVPGDPVAMPICLATPDATEPGAFRVIDGMHRAIQLVRNGQATIRLCVVRDRGGTASAPGRPWAG